MKVSLTFAERLDDLVVDATTDPTVTAKTIAGNLVILESSLSEYRNGKKKPNIDTLIKLANYFEVSADWLLGLSEDPKRQPSAVEDLNLSPNAVYTLKQVKEGKLSSYLSLWIEQPRFYELIHSLMEYVNAMAAFQTYNRYRENIELLYVDGEIDMHTVTQHLDIPYNEEVLCSCLKSILRQKGVDEHEAGSEQMDFMASLRRSYTDYQMLEYKIVDMFRSFVSSIISPVDYYIAPYDDEIPF